MRQDKKPLFAIEEDLIGVSHAEVGAYLLSLWGLPSPVVEAVAHHHHPERVPHGSLDMISVVYLANMLAHEHAGTEQEKSVAGQPMDPNILAIPVVAENLAEWNTLASTIAREPEGARHV